MQTHHRQIHRLKLLHSFLFYLCDSPNLAALVVKIQLFSLRLLTAIILLYHVTDTRYCCRCPYHVCVHALTIIYLLIIAPATLYFILLRRKDRFTYIWTFNNAFDISRH